MEKNKIENYISQLKDLDEILNNIEDDEIVPDDFNDSLNEILLAINKEIGGKPINPVMLQVNVKKLHPEAVIPEYSKPGDAGMDLVVTSISTNTSSQVVYNFGLAMEIPLGYVGLLFPRSSVKNMELIMSNCVGVIDSGYRGEVMAVFNKTNGLDSWGYKIGDKAAQIIIIPFPQVKFNQVDELSTTERGIGGFGSTNNPKPL